MPPALNCWTKCKKSPNLVTLPVSGPLQCDQICAKFCQSFKKLKKAKLAIFWKFVYNLAKTLSLLGQKLLCKAKFQYGNLPNIETNNLTNRSHCLPAKNKTKSIWMQVVLEAWYPIKLTASNNVIRKILNYRYHWS